jgi:hypothetical protein
MRPTTFSERAKLGNAIFRILHMLLYRPSIAGSMIRAVDSAWVPTEIPGGDILRVARRATA